MRARVTVTVELVDVGSGPHNEAVGTSVTVTREQLVAVIPARPEHVQAAAHYAAGRAAGSAVQGALAALPERTPGA